MFCLQNGIHFHKLFLTRRFAHSHACLLHVANPLSTILLHVPQLARDYLRVPCRLQKQLVSKLISIAFTIHHQLLLVDLLSRRGDGKEHVLFKVFHECSRDTFCLRITSSTFN